MGPFNALAVINLLLAIQYSQVAAAPLQEQVALRPQEAHIPEQENKYVLPAFDPRPLSRIEEIQLNREGWQYGAPLLGNTSFFPTGLLGDARVREDRALWLQDVAYVTQQVYGEIEKATRALTENGGLQNLSSFAVLYQDQWQSTIPTGVEPGVLSKFSDDRTFSMERLSLNPYVMNRVHPTAHILPFPVLDSDVKRLAAGHTLQDLHQAGRLFIADHSSQAGLPLNADRYTGACTALLFVHPSSGDLMPLAIRLNPDSELIFTPLDSESDWMFAKMAFGMNDLFHGQIFHLATSHEVAESVHQAALRTMSGRHPIREFLDRIMYRAYAVRLVGDEFLFNPGGFFDQSFSVQNAAGRQFATKLYHSSTGQFRSSQLHADLLGRGLLNCSYGPELQSFPFFEDVDPIVSVLQDFATAYVHAYYPSETHLAQDSELQEWIIEALDAAKVLDFVSSPLQSRDVLISILTHMSFLTGVGHHVLNSLTPGASSGLLPMHPAMFKKPLPTAKGQIDDIMSYIANETEAVMQASLLVRFNSTGSIQPATARRAKGESCFYVVGQQVPRRCVPAGTTSRRTISRGHAQHQLSDTRQRVRQERPIAGDAVHLEIAGSEADSLLPQCLAMRDSVTTLGHCIDYVIS